MQTGHELGMEKDPVGHANWVDRGGAMHAQLVPSLHNLAIPTGLPKKWSITLRFSTQLVMKPGAIRNDELGTNWVGL